MKVVVYRQIKGTRCFLCPPCVTNWSFIDNQHVNMNVALCALRGRLPRARGHTPGWRRPQSCQLLLGLMFSFELMCDIVSTSPHFTLSGSERSASRAASSVEAENVTPLACFRPHIRLNKSERVSYTNHLPRPSLESRKHRLLMCLCVLNSKCSWGVGVGPWAVAAAGPSSQLLRVSLWGPCRLSSSHLLWQTAGTQPCHSYTPKHTGHLTRWSHCDWRGLYWWRQLGPLVRL